MGPGLLTAFFFALSAVFSQRATRLFGSLPAHFYRLCGAAVVLWAVFALSGAAEPPAQIRHYFWASGLLGFGLGDAFLFAAYPRLGSRITILIQFCLSALTGVLGDWLWIGKSLSWQAGGAILLILSGLSGTVLSKGENRVTTLGSRPLGLFFASCSALCMGLGTVVSNHAIELCQQNQVSVAPSTQAFLRVSAGVLVAGILWLGQLKFFPPLNAEPKLQQSKPMKAFWLTGTCLMGPVIGVTCYQWALLELRSSALVLALAATSSLIIMPLARWLERDRPSRGEIIGSLFAIAGVIWLRLLMK
jgi:drug/metabolite transporter (DMT)-like permease